MLDPEVTREPDRQHISLPPLPSVLIESLRNIGYTMDTALADIIDNSITAQASKISIRFEWCNGSPWIAIVDDGYGMSKDTLREAMRFGSNSPARQRDLHDLGRFGLGMKTASISQCRKVTVCSKHDWIIHCCEWDLDMFTERDSSAWLLKVFEESEIDDEILDILVKKNLSNIATGTIVLWRNLDSVLLGTDIKVSSETKFNEIMHNARKHLETVFHRFLTPEHVATPLRIDFNGSVLKAFNPFGPSIPSRQELPLEVIGVEGEEVLIQPYVLPHRSKVNQQEYDLYAGEEGYLQNQGFYVYRNKRMIMKATWFRLIKKDELNKLIRVRIDIPNSLDHLWGININKSQVTPPEVVKKQLKRIINKISGRGKRVFTQKKARVLTKGLIALWNREVIDGKVFYAINYDHPMIKEILDCIEDKQKNRLVSCLDMITSSFPYDIYYSDAASDDMEISKDVDLKVVRELCHGLISSYKQCKVAKEEVFDKLIKIEIPAIGRINIDEIINEVYYDNRC